MGLRKAMGKLGLSRDSKDKRFYDEDAPQPHTTGRRKVDVDGFQEEDDNDEAEEEETFGREGGLEPDSMDATPGYKSVAYFCNWAIYDRKHFPADIPVDRVTHVMYAFANVDPDTGAVILTDPWADTDCKIGDRPPSPGGTGPNAEKTAGCFGEFYRIKRDNQHLKTLLSIGGWSFSNNFAAGVNTDAKRATFAKSAVDLINLLALDGLDLDWEYAIGPEQAMHYVDVCRRTRHELDLLASELNVPRDQLDLTIAAPGGMEQAGHLRIGEMDKYLSFWNLMTYDYAGPWSPVTSYHANLYNGSLSAHDTVNLYIRGGASPEKLVLGIPIYGRAFANTRGIGKPHQGTIPGTWEEGVFDYKHLPLPGSKEVVDKKSWAAYCEDKKQNVIVTYDNPETIRAKADYIKRMNLGGVMYWESSADYPVDDPRSIIGTITNELAYLDMRENRVMQEYLRRRK